MKCLLVTAHPLPDSLCALLADRARETLEALGHEVVVEDLYRAGFSPCLTPAERRSYYSPRYDSVQTHGEAAHLLAADALVLVFPTWWFGFPAILKGWFDRVWGPGIAYDHGRDFGPITPRLANLRYLVAVTTLGSPWWVDRLVMRQPVRKVPATALVATCAPRCRFQMLSLYKAERVDRAKLDRFTARLQRTLRAWR